jgi:hypothetical protein
MVKLDKREQTALKFFWDLLKNISDDIRNAEKVTSDIKKKKEPKVVRDSFDVRDMASNLKMAYIYSHVYVPKYRDDDDVLPFYDAFPLYVPFNIKKGRIFAFNIHYLRPAIRRTFITSYIEHLRKKVDTIYDSKYKKRFINKDGIIDLDLVSPSFIDKHGMDYMLTFARYVVKSKLKNTIKSYLPGHIVSKVYRLSFRELETFSYLNMVFAPVFKKKTASEIYAIIDENYNRYKDSVWKIK